MPVYFLRPIGMPGPVKIGASVEPEARMATYQRWSPFPLEIVVAVKGGRELEARFHALFSRLHSHHEWFKGHPEIDAVIDALKAGTFDLSGLPEPMDLRRKMHPVRRERSRAFTGLHSRLYRHYGPYNLPPGLAKAARTMRELSKATEDEKTEAALRIFEAVEKKAPRPDSISTRYCRQLLAERSAAHTTAA